MDSKKVKKKNKNIKQTAHQVVWMRASKRLRFETARVILVRARWAVTRG